MKYILKIFILTICLLSVGEAWSQTEDKLCYDTDEITLRNSDKIEDFKNDSDFNYDESVEAPVSLWEKFWHWVGNVLDAIFSNKGIAPYILYTVVGIIVLAVAVKLFGLDYQTVFLRSTKLKSAVDFETYEDDIHGMDLDLLIVNAQNSAKYQLAVRYLYLKLLKELSDKEIIIWEIEKTNLDYRKEISKTGFDKPFTRLTFLYEHIWYGDFEIEKDKFLKTERSFTSLFSKL